MHDEAVRDEVLRGGFHEVIDDRLRRPFQALELRGQRVLVTLHLLIQLAQPRGLRAVRVEADLSLKQKARGA